MNPAVLYFADCGIGSDPNATGPCVGGSGPASAAQDAAQLGQSAVSTFAGGHGMIVAIGAALLALTAVRLLLWYVRQAAKGSAKPKAPDDIEEDCERCGADAAGEFQGEVLCESCLTDARNDALADEIAALEEGEGLCLRCGLHYDVEEGGCPVCGSWDEEGEDDAASADSDGPARDPVEAADDAAEAVDESRACAVCGLTVHDGEGRETMFGPVHTACEEQAEAAARIAEIDWDGPGDEETFHGNPRGVGADDEGIRA